MNNESTKTNAITSIARRWALACAVIGLIPGIGQADVWDTIWDITGVSRSDVTAIKAPGMIPEHTVDIFDDSYNFNADGTFPILGVNAGWTQKTSKGQTQYSVSFDQYDVVDLENIYRDKLEKSDPNITVHQVKLLSRKVAGSELDNGIWGTERYEYKVDSSLNGFRDVVRVVQFVQVAGYKHVAAPAGILKAAKAAGVEPKRSDAMDAAVSAVVQHMRKRSAAAQ